MPSIHRSGADITALSRNSAELRTAVPLEVLNNVFSELLRQLAG